MTTSHTHILLKFLPHNGLNEKTIEFLLKEKMFEDLKFKYQPYEDNIYSLTIYAINMPLYEKKRDLLIRNLKNITEYLSITHDSHTKYYIEKIGETIYDLERSFRTLIEFVLLKKYKSEWKKSFPSLGHDRRSRRGDPFIYLDNPLDDMDFIHLSRFTKEQINIIDHSLQAALNLIGESISNINSTSDINKIKENVLIKVDELLHAPKKSKNNEIKYTSLYSHITPSISADWENLYNLRNFWAHNTALMTRAEFENYKSLYEKVIENIRTEITVITLFSGNQEPILEIGQSTFKVTLYKSNYEGRATVQLKGKFMNEESHKISFKKTFITYSDVLNLFKQILNVANESEKLTELEACFEYNPFLKEDFIELGNSVSNAFNNLGNKKGDIFTYLSQNNYDIYTDDNMVKMSEDVETYLKEIF